MPGLKDLLKKKEKLAAGGSGRPGSSQTTSKPAANLNVPEFTFVRTTTESEEVIKPPVYSSDEDDNASASTSSPKGKKTKDSGEHKRMLGFRRSSHTTPKKDSNEKASTREVVQLGGDDTSQQLPVRPKNERRLSERLHLGSRNRSTSRASSNSQNTSVHLPSDLPDAPDAVSASFDGSKEDSEHREAQWTKRATILAQGNPLRDLQQTLPRSPSGSTFGSQASTASRPSSPQPAATTEDDDKMQTAIRLHEEGDLTKSTQLFASLASPSGANNALAQVLYGLALRHGWGIPPDPAAALHYLSLAASNSASIEAAALQASDGKKSGAAKGELVLAIFELGNSFRHGWGVKKDPVAARQYYETAANLGDSDAMEEAAWCLMEGFGGAKDKYRAAQYLRLAEQKGSRNVGNSWIWKVKYNPK